MSKARFNSRQLSVHLREIAAEAQTVDNEGNLVTNGEKLARILWDRALGYTETRKNDKGENIEVPHTPEAWAIQLVYDRLEGKTPQAIADDAGRITAAQKVGDLNRDRINKMATVAAAKANRLPLNRIAKALPPKPPKLGPKKEPPDGSQS